MEKADTPRRIDQEISVQQIGVETLIYDGRRHLAFCLNAICSEVWNLADGSRTETEIREAASLKLDTAVSEELLALTLQTLRSDGLIHPIVDPVSPGIAEPVISRRTMLQKLGVGGAMLLPAITSIVAPTAAQAYNGCVDCSTSNSRAARIRKLQQSSGASQ